MMKNFDVVIIGAGAAGLMCAIEAGKRGRKVVVLERGGKPAQKIRISGGGRCNFTNLDVTYRHFLSQNPRFCLSALKRYTPADFIALVERHNIEYFSKSAGQLFCRHSAQDIIDMLLDECARAGAVIHTQTEIMAVKSAGSGFEVQTDRGTYACASLVIASGGPSIPKMGSTGFGYAIARQFGIDVITPRPGLVPLTFSPEILARLAPLSGNSLEVDASCNGATFREALLFTHRGLSGPAILQISSYWREGMEISINFAPGTDVYALLAGLRRTSPKRTLHTALAGLMPKAVAKFVCVEAKVDGVLGGLSNKALQHIADTTSNWTVKPGGSEGYRTAEVTLGGVDTNELSSRTFEAKKVPGLYFIGEVIDVTGHLGGYNFHWAWASGHAAGQFA